MITYRKIGKTRYAVIKLGKKIGSVSKSKSGKWRVYDWLGSLLCDGLETRAAAVDFMQWKYRMLYRA
jgi:hypothetical protein